MVDGAPGGRARLWPVDAPAGTVTFLFTDIEGSTRLWESAPVAMRAALTRHDALLRAAISAHSGYVFSTGGDGFAASFARGADALAAAADAQQALGVEPWPDGASLKVRMGLHTGEVEERDGDYFGPAVNRAARLMAVAHGGQTVCSAATAGVVDTGVVLVDLGEHRLRDLAEAQRVFQLGEETFPPLRSVEAFRTNLPRELSSFIGRDTELQAVAKQLAAGRVVSIVGVGGVGKTRLALHVASDLLPNYADGAWVCELASVTEPASIPDAVAAALGYAPPQGVPVAEGLARFLERKNLLLVLDNCEHLIDAAAAFVTTTVAAAGVSVLATSREGLGVRGEQIYPLGSLSLPTAGDAVSVLGSEAGALFVTRAAEAGRTVDVDGPAAQTVQDLCVRLDGIPLAIELAAARTAMMTPAEIVARLGRQFRLLTGGGRSRLERHQTLRAAIDWSYELLTGNEQALLNRLSVCVGGFDLAAATAIAAGTGVDEFDALELLGLLVAKSLVERSEQNGVTRYRLLEMIRQYTAEQLGNAADVARDDHARHYLTVTTDLFTQMVTSPTYEPYDRLTLETPNIAAAARWLLASNRDEDLLGWFGALPFVDYFVLPTRFNDDLGAIAGELVQHATAAACDGFTEACFHASARAFLAGDLRSFDAFVTLTEQHPTGRTQARTVIGRSCYLLFTGEVDSAIELAHQATELARVQGQPSVLAWVSAFSAATEGYQDSRSMAVLAAAVEGVDVARRSGGVLGLLYSLFGLTVAARELDPELALAAAQECARLDRTERRTWAASSRLNVASLHLARGHIAAGLSAWLEALKPLTDNGERNMISAQIGTLAEALAPIEPQDAINLAAIAESPAIAARASFVNGVKLAELAAVQTAAVTEAHARSVAYTYDEAMAIVTAIIERLIADHTHASEA